MQPHFSLSEGRVGCRSYVLIGMYAENLKQEAQTIALQGLHAAGRQE
jgi:hypothetical protein